MVSTPQHCFLLFPSQIRENMKLDNLAKTYMADLIKKECWDNMVVKGRGISVSAHNLQRSDSQALSSRGCLCEDSWRENMYLFVGFCQRFGSE